MQHQHYRGALFRQTAGLPSRPSNAFLRAVRLLVWAGSETTGQEQCCPQWVPTACVLSNEQVKVWPGEEVELALFTEDLKGKIKEFGTAAVLGAGGGIRTARTSLGAGIQGKVRSDPAHHGPGPEIHI